tara:strand:- start:3589 stop:4614 length:1026 start_codon:yes stop_codon:yes gene_type:complete
MSLGLHDFDFELPERLIAQYPAHPRDHAKLLVYDRVTQSIQDCFFYELDNLLNPDTTLVLNNTRVEKCRLLFEDGKMEVFVLETIDPYCVQALVRPGKKFKVGKTISLAPSLRAQVLSISEGGLRTLRLSHTYDDPIFESFKHTPLPPYIVQNEALSEEYQTIYAKYGGSKAAPTAGLHFTSDLMQRIAKSGVAIEELTLHVGMGTFAPVKTERIQEHIMHEENYLLTEKVASRLAKSRHITAVGTTSVRVLESVVAINSVNVSHAFRKFNTGSGSTDIFITPGYRYQAVDALITNFHLPKSTLLMLVAAFVGLEEMHRIYAHAIASEYRFYSFGDAMLLR